MPEALMQSPVLNFPREVDLLLCCARTHLEPATVERLRHLLREELHWQVIIQTAHLHGIIPLLTYHLRLICPEAVPETILRQLQHHARAAALNNLVMTGELLKLLALFKAQGIPAIPYKGPVLAMMAYGSLALRPFSDLDIVVGQGDILCAKELLRVQGYRPWKPLTAAQEAVHLRTYHAYTFVHSNGRLSVDLHWRFAQRWSAFSFPLGLETLWERLETLNLAGTAVRILPPEELLLILCVHGAKEGWPRLKWICDLAQLVRAHQGMDWERLMGQAKRLRSERILFVGLLLAHHLLDVALPAAVLQQVQKHPVVGRLAVQVCRQLFSATTLSAKIMARHAFHLRVIECLEDRMSYVLYYLCTRMIPNEKDREFLSLPAPLSALNLHYMIRPIRLAKEYGLDLMRYLLQRNT